MRTKTLITLLFALILSCGPLRAQEERTVRGLVADESGQFLSGATLKAEGIDTPFKTNKVGQFEIKIPFSSKTLTAFVDGYAPLTMDAAATFILFKMKVQKSDNTPSQAQQEALELARLKALKEARERAEQEKKEREQAENAAGGARGKDRGLLQSVELSYVWQPYSGKMVYTNSGVRPYSTLHPVQLTYAIGWKFNKMFSLTAGAGFLYNIVSLERTGDTPEAGLYGDTRPLRYDVPAFLNLRCHLFEDNVQPYFTLGGGIYALSLAPLMDLGVGVCFHLGGSLGLNIALSARNTPWPLFSESGFGGYPIRIVPAVTAGLSF